jgi:hypothetical protein
MCLGTLGYRCCGGGNCGRCCDDGDCFEAGDPRQCTSGVCADGQCTAVPVCGPGEICCDSVCTPPPCVIGFGGVGGLPP